MNAFAGSRNILVIHGPNLNMLGKREPEVYGRQTLADIDGDLKALAADLGIAVACFQSNHEGEIVERIHAAMGGIQGLIINPGAYTHTSVAIRDALQMLSCPIVEVHISNVYRREAFRHKSLISDVVTGKIVGLGAMGYRLALTALAGMDTIGDGKT
jgi:3-dehydroquinate dehydratase II